MINFICDKRIFDEQTKEKNNILIEDKQFPENVYKKHFGQFLFFEFDYIYSEDFYQQLLLLLKLQKKDFFTFYTLCESRVKKLDK